MNHDDNIRVISCPRPFAFTRDEATVAAGKTISDLIEMAGIREGIPVVVSVNGVPVHPLNYHTTTPGPGSLIAIRAHCTGGSEGGKGLVRSVLLIAVVAVATAGFGAGGLGMAGMGLEGAALTAAVSVTTIGASLLINQLIPPTSPNLPTSAGQRTEAASATLSIAGGRNQLTPYGVIPQVLGTHKFSPPLGAKPVTEFVGGVQYLRQLFCIGYGPVNITDLKIGGTDISYFSDIETEIRYGTDSDLPITLYNKDQSVETFSIKINKDTSITKFTPSGSVFIDIVFAMPQGIFFTDTESGEFTEATRRFTIFYKKKSSSTYSPLTYANVSKIAKPNGITAGSDDQLGNYYIRGNTRTGFSVQISCVFTDTSEEYEWVIADGFAFAEVYEYSFLYLTSITTSGTTNAIRLDTTTERNIAFIALRIKATDQLNGYIDTFNCLVSSVMPDYDKATDSWIPRVTENPASIYRHVLQGNANKRPLGDDEVDILGLEEWHQDCEANGWLIGHVVDYRTSVEDMLKTVAAVGRATPGYIDGKYGVVRDVLQADPIQHFTPRNSWGYSGNKMLVELPHAFRVKFWNKYEDYKEDEILVYSDGYNYSNASEFEELTLLGVVDPELAWKHGRYHLSTAQLRPETHTFYCDVEHLVCTRGDLIKFAHDSALLGLGWGRVKSVTDDGTYITSITLDELLSMETGKSYNIRFRKSSGSSVLVNIDTVAGESASVIVSDTLLIANGPEVGDLAMFGELSSESVDLIIKSIEPSGDMTCRITAVDAAPAIHTSDTGVIPEYYSNISTPTYVNRTVIPVISLIRSDEAVTIINNDGTATPVIAIQFSDSGILPGLIEKTFVRYRVLGQSIYAITEVAGLTEVTILNVAVGKTYEVSARTQIDGELSNWSPSIQHVVVGFTSLPPDIQTLFVQNDIIRWQYPDKPKDFAGFVVKHRAGELINWADATAAHDGLWPATYFDISVLPGGTRTIMVKGVDVGGRESENASYIVITGDPLEDIQNIISTTDYHPTYSGTITNGTIVAGEILADLTGDLFWATEAASLFWGVDTSLFWTVNILPMTYTATYTPAAADLPANIVLDYFVVGNPFTVEYYDPNIGYYVAWPGSLYVDSSREFTFKLYTGSGSFRGVISSFSVLVDAADIIENFNDVSIAAAGTRLSIAETYRAIVNVKLTLQDDGGTAVTTRVMDKDATNGPLIKCFDITGASVTGTIDATIQGY